MFTRSYFLPPLHCVCVDVFGRVLWISWLSYSPQALFWPYEMTVASDDQFHRSNPFCLESADRVYTVVKQHRRKWIIYLFLLTQSQFPELGYKADVQHICGWFTKVRNFKECRKTDSSFPNRSQMRRWLYWLVLEKNNKQQTLYQHCHSSCVLTAIFYNPYFRLIHLWIRSRVSWNQN